MRANRACKCCRIAHPFSRATQYNQKNRPHLSQPTQIICNLLRIVGGPSAAAVAAAAAPAAAARRRVRLPALPTVGELQTGERRRARRRCEGAERSTKTVPARRPPRHRCHMRRSQPLRLRRSLTLHAGAPPAPVRALTQPGSSHATRVSTNTRRSALCNSRPPLPPLKGATASPDAPLSICCADFMPPQRPLTL
jgi:hypothetical protein